MTAGVYKPLKRVLALPAYQLPTIKIVGYKNSGY